MRTQSERAFYSAMQFHEAAIRCGELEGEGSHNVMEPMAVCFGLALELYLKALILRHEPSVSGHDLSVFFEERLKPVDREVLAARYMELRNAPRSRMLRELKAVSDVFVRWRYSHEDEALGSYVDHDVLSTFAKAFFLAARQIEPSWEVLPYFQDRLTTKQRLTFACYIADGPPSAAFDQMLRRSIMGTVIASRRHPQSDITKGENDGFNLAVPVLDFQGQAATFNIKVRGGPYAQNSRTRERIKYGAMFPLPIVAGKPRLDCKRAA